MVNNLQIILPLLEFPDEDSFYFVQILQRKKDNKGLGVGGSNNSARLIKAYYVKSTQYLEDHMGEMIKLAEVFNARVNINLNPRNSRKAAFQFLRKVADQMMNQDFSAVSRAYNSVCGEYHAEIDRRWLIDIDKDDLERLPLIRSAVEQLHTTINNKDYKILSEIPSKSGVHIVTNPFNKEKFTALFPTIEIHPNNPVNLYCP